MIGVFVRNAAGEVGFLRPPGETDIVDIAAFHYAPHARIMTVETVDGGDETFTSEIAPELHEAFVSATQVLVAHLDERGEPTHEYWTPLSIGAP